MVSRLESTAQSFEQKLAKIGMVINFPSANLSVKHPCFAPLEDLLMQRNMYWWVDSTDSKCVLKFRQNYYGKITYMQSLNFSSLSIWSWRQLRSFWLQFGGGQPINNRRKNWQLLIWFVTSKYLQGEWNPCLGKLPPFSFLW